MLGGFLLDLDSAVTVARRARLVRLYDFQSTPKSSEMLQLAAWTRKACRLDSSRENHVEETLHAARIMNANLKQPRLKWLLRFVTLVKQSRSDRATESCLRTQWSDTHKQKQAWKQIYLYMDATACTYINTINDCIQCTCKRSNRWHECTAGRDESNWGIRA